VNRVGPGIVRLNPRDDGGWFAIDYVPGSLDDPRWDLVKALKAGEPGAIQAAAALLARVFLDPPLPGPISLVAVPGHTAGAATVTEDLCRRLAAMLPWCAHRSGIVRRSRTIRRSATSTSRPTIEEHLQKLRVASPVVGSVIIVDDVFTHGRVTEACTRLLRDAGASEVIVAAVARTRT